MKYYLITGKRPTETEGVYEDNRILIGESNPFDSSGKPFQPATHADYGIFTVDSWKRLITIYAQRITQEFIVTPDGLRQDLQSEVVPAAHLFGLLNDGFVKEGRREGSLDKVIYWKQKGRIEDDAGQTYTAEAMIRILEDKA